MVALLVVVAPSYATLTAPSPLSPANSGSVDSVPVFNWTAVAGADHYQFQIAATNTFSPALYSFDTRNTRAALTDALQNKTYYWRVRAMTAGGVGGAWSPTRSMVMNWSDKAEPTTPADGASITYPDPLLLNWTAVPGAEKYRVVLATTPDLSSQVTGTEFPVTTQASAYALQSRLPDGTYYWGVIPIDAEGHDGTPSDVFEFTYTWPSDATTLTLNDLSTDPGVFDPQFSWTPVAGAAYYKVDVSSDPEFPSGSIVCCNGETVATSMTPTTLLPPSQAYYWRVTPYDASNQAGTSTVWSDQNGDPQTFTITFDTGASSIPDLSMRDAGFDPIAWSSGGMDTSTPIVGWGDVPGAAFYEVQVSPYTNSACDWATKTWDVDTVTTAWTPLGDGHNALGDPVPQSQANLASDLPALGGAYCARVKAHRGDDTTHNSVYGAWSYVGDGSGPSFTFTGYPSGSACQSCTTGYLGSADYLLPQTGASSADMPVFTWNPIQGAQSYYVVVATDASFTNIVDYAFTKVPAYAPRGGLTGVTNYPNGTYYWAVLPAVNLDGTGVSADPSLAPAKSFTKQVTAPTLSAVTVSGLGPVLQWSAVQGAVDYHVQISDTSDFSKLSPPDGIDQRVAETSYTASSTLPANKTIYWRVEAEAEGNMGSTIGLGRSQRGQFSTTLGVPSFTTPTNFPNVTSSSTIPVWQWNPVAGAASYDVNLTCAVGATCSDGSFDTTAAVMTTSTGTQPLQWQVRAEFPTIQFGVPGQAVPGTYTAQQNYTATIPAPANLSAAASGAHTFSMGWSPVNGMKQYKVEVSSSPATNSDGSFASTVEQITTYTTNAAPRIMNVVVTPNAYTNGGTLYWHVAAIDDGSNLGAFSPTKTFKLPVKIVVASTTSYLAHGTTTTITVTTKDAKGHAVGGVTVKVSGGGMTALSKKSSSTGKVSFKVHPKKKGKLTITGTKAGLQSGWATLPIY
jgi:hypothetical protein